MAVAQKKVVIRRMGYGALLRGYLPASGFVCDGQVEFIEVDGRAKSILVNEISAIFYVKDFNFNDPLDPERLGRRSFVVRPRGEGLWLRLEFHEMPPLEGLVALDLGFLDDLIAAQGLFLTPPDGRSNTLKLFVPRGSIRSMEVLGLVTSPTRKLAAKSARQVALAQQAGLFEDLPGSN